MTIEEAITKIPPGWRLRLTNWQDAEESGWGAELFHATNTRRGVGDEDDPVTAILAAISSLER